MVGSSLFLIYSFLLFGKLDVSASKKATQVTLPIEDRVALLKSKIADQIKKHGVHANFQEDVTAVNEDVEYENLENQPITPISENDPRKKRDRFKLQPIKTTRGLRDLTIKSVSKTKNTRELRNLTFKSVSKTKTTSDFRNLTLKSVSKTPLRNVEPKLKLRSKKKMPKKSQITDVFYRRFSENFSYQWTHCQALITPFLTGHKTNMTVKKRITYDDHKVVRLIQLLTEDTTDHTKEEIHSILYHISNLQIRLFQWDVAAIKLLLSVISRENTNRQAITLRGLKTGLKQIFANWNLQYKSNLGVLMKQTRLFRPPCIKLMEYEGSTKTSKSIRYTKSVKPKKKCSNDDEYDYTCRS